MLGFHWMKRMLRRTSVAVPSTSTSAVLAPSMGQRARAQPADGKTSTICHHQRGGGDVDAALVAKLVGDAGTRPAAEELEQQLHPRIIAKWPSTSKFTRRIRRPRLIRKAVDIVRQGGVIAYPTDSCYALGCHVGDKDALERIRRIRDADKHHHFTLVCRNLAEIARYARVETWQFRLLKAHTPGPFTFLLPATRGDPQAPAAPEAADHRHPRAGSPVPHLLLAELGEPIMSSTLLLPGDDTPLTDGAADPRAPRP